jgi:hypothetical protein
MAEIEEFWQGMDGTYEEGLAVFQSRRELPETS